MRLKNTATMIFHERSASHRITSYAEHAVSVSAPRCFEITEN